MKKFKLGPVKRKDLISGLDSTEILFITEEAALVKYVWLSDAVSFVGESLESLHKDYIPNNEPRRHEEVVDLHFTSTHLATYRARTPSDRQVTDDFLRSIGHGKKVKIMYEEVLE